MGFARGPMLSVVKSGMGAAILEKRRFMVRALLMKVDSFSLAKGGSITRRAWKNSGRG